MKSTALVSCCLWERSIRFVLRFEVLLAGCLLNSNTTGLSYMSAQWLRNGSVVKSYDASYLWYTDTVSLRMESVDNNNTGTYACRAANKYGTVVSLSANVEVKPRKFESGILLLICA